MKKYGMLPALLLLCSGFIFCQSGDINISARPMLTVPLGPELDDGTAFYTAGGGVSLEGTYTPSSLPYLLSGLLLDATVVPINGSDQNASFLSIGPSLGLQYQPIARLNLGLRGFGGIYMGIIEAGSVRDPFWGGGAFAAYRINPGLSIGLDAEYRDYMTSGESALQGLSFGLGVRYQLGGASRGADLYYVPELIPIFPLFYSYYENNPAGVLHLENRDSLPLNSLKVSFYVRQFMDQPKLCAEYRTFPAGAQETVPVYALFSEEIFRVTEGTKVAGELLLEYDYIGTSMSTTVPVTVIVNNRNAMTWDDDRKAAAFVTARDPLVMSFAKNVAAVVGSDKSTAINENFRTALGVYEALGVYGMGYVQDPTTPYAEFSANKEALDYLQFPNQSIAYKAGDCDDLSILYAALLESVGIRTAFITAPGHIYMAFALGMAPEQAEKLFIDTRELIFREDDTWIPVEITLVREGFLKSWQIGAREWRETSEAGTAGFYSVREAWKLYEPVGFAAGGAGIMLPNEDRLMENYRKALITFINRQIEPRVIELNGQLASATNTVWTRNKLGILYARFGVLDKAAEQFRAILRISEYVPAMVNLGNIYYLQGEMSRALEYYDRASRTAPNNSKALLGVARASYELERYDETDRALQKLRSTAPGLASEFAYLGSAQEGTGRASQALKREVGSWDEEE
ncbi:hypothetical protein B4O97_15495 [Marispirochaeta aestuarii]|uniref:Transglutaminase-like domain-containing protein n=1 Tax=Marispirochaeta aestuarii TaxID=1963862 RepID=A0A1Y1RUU0_9SPIO|nr:tetratricopeptide repeat protein [Marispirochaeta aestuarii]ORC32856.1 hypothetical protein B4O97_15495 [Marispirochaeta aestuarii]